MEKKKRHREVGAEQEIQEGLEDLATGIADEKAAAYEADGIRVHPCQGCFDDDRDSPDEDGDMSEPELPNLGRAPGRRAGRDAVHVALAPVEAGETLQPGQHVGLGENGRACGSDNPIGIVDPFLTHTVLPGERLWLLLYQGSVTNLRHEWTHPAFITQDSTPEAPPQTDFTGSPSASAPGGE